MNAPHYILNSCRLKHVLSVLALIVCLGCGKGTTKLDTFPVSGKVMLPNGKALTGGSVQLSTVTEPVVNLIGDIKDDGTFSLRTNLNGTIYPGGVAGEYQVTVYPPQGEDQNVVPITLGTTVVIKEGQPLNITVDPSAPQPK